MNQGETYWVYRDDMPVKRSGSYEEVEAFAMKQASGFPGSELRIVKREVFETHMRTFKRAIPYGQQAKG
jgi:hypothetical protein